MTTPSNPLLSQLEDIQLPPEVTDLPIAPGYWLLLAFIIFIMAISLRALYRRRRYHAPRKAALVILLSYDIDSDEFAAEVNTLLKRTALSYLPREKLAKLNGPQWFDWLDTRLPAMRQQEFGPLLVKRHQAKGLTLEDKLALLGLAKLWLSNSKKFTQAHLLQGDEPC
jgi:hypothetical protein